MTIELCAGQILGVPLNVHIGEVVQACGELLDEHRLAP
jgi:hypothetical protein